MTCLEKMREAANQAYREAVDTKDHKQKKKLLEKFYKLNVKYNQHKNWLLALKSH